MWEPVVALADFKIHLAVTVVALEVVFNDELLRNVRHFDAYIFGIWHGHVKIDFFRSMVLNCALFQERTLFRRSLTNSRKAVLVPTSPG